jgi:hypothetical protein
MQFAKAQARNTKTSKHRISVLRYFGVQVFGRAQGLDALADSNGKSLEGQEEKSKAQSKESNPKA